MVNYDFLETTASRTFGALCNGFELILLRLGGTMLTLRLLGFRLVSRLVIAKPFVQVPVSELADSRESQVLTLCTNYYIAQRVEHLLTGRVLHLIARCYSPMQFCKPPLVTPLVPTPTNENDNEKNKNRTTPARPSQLAPQLVALLSSLFLITSQDRSPTPSEFKHALSRLRDPSQVLTSELVRAIEALDKQALGVFRGCKAADWLFGAAEDGPVEWDVVERQANGDLARGLRKAGLRSVVVGETSEEWYLYALSHAYPSPPGGGGGDRSSEEMRWKVWAEDAVARYIPRPIARQFVEAYEACLSPTGVSSADHKESRIHPAERLAGLALSAAQVYVPVRRLERDLGRASRGGDGGEGGAERGIPVVRYVIEWAPEAAKQRVFGGRVLVFSCLLFLSSVVALSRLRNTWYGPPHLDAVDLTHLARTHRRRALARHDLWCRA